MSAPFYELIRVTGPDAGAFLQGQLTQDVQRIAATGCLLAAWCNAKGRVVALFKLFAIEDGYGLVLLASMSRPVCERLKVYRLRSKVDLELAGPDWACRVVREQRDLDRLEQLGLLPERRMNACRLSGKLLAVNIGIEEICVELMGEPSDLSKAGLDDVGTDAGDFLAGAKIRAGMPEVHPAASEKYTPQMLNLDLIGAISFDKGCYTGQEVIARTRFLGETKRRLMRFRAAGKVEAGDRLSNREVDVGEVFNVCDGDLLAVVSMDARDRQLTTDGTVVTPAALPYALPHS